MNTYNKNIYSAVALVAVFILVFSLGFQSGEKSRHLGVENVELQNKETDTKVEADFGAFWKAWNLINEKYVPASSTLKAVTDEEKVWGAISGLASSLDDPYTVFLPPVENEIFESDVRGNFEGVGMEVGIRDGVLTVIAPLKGTPAYNAGIKTGDRITNIDGVTTYNLSTEESVLLIRGEKGTRVVFTIIREGSDEPLEIGVIRDVINIPTLSTSLRADGVFVIELYNFSENSPNLFRAALREFVDANTDKLLLDLRGNPGGYLEASIDMASWFLAPGKVVVREDFAGKQEEVIHRSRGYDIFNSNLKFVILVNGGSASASEILAGALKEHGVAKLVGNKTFGKGSVQELISITPETSLKVTIARWLTPNGVSISASGVAPHFEVKNTPEDVKNGVDREKDKAIEVLLNW
jgi:carboxyl-terminal processing protease